MCCLAAAGGSELRGEQPSVAPCLLPHALRSLNAGPPLFPLLMAASTCGGWKGLRQGHSRLDAAAASTHCTWLHANSLFRERPL